MRKIALLFCLACPLLAQQGPVNLDFQDSGPQGTPTGWTSSSDASYSLTTTDNCPTAGARCAMIQREGIGDRVYVMQTFDATALQGKQVRYRAALRSDPGLSRAQIFARVDRPTGAGFQAYSPSTLFDDWTTREIAGTIDADAVRITIGLIFNGRGTIYFGDAAFETVDNPR